jgi:hypothetical protein
MPLAPTTTQRLLGLVPMLQAAKERIPRPEWGRRPREHAFSLVEQVCHLRDVEEEGYTLRIRRLLREDNPELADFDGAKVAQARDYRKQDLTLALNALDLARRQNVAVLADLPTEALHRRGRMAGVGEITLERLATMMLEHDASHRQELEELFTALGR